MSSPPDLLGLFIEPLERLNLDYFITGGVATVIYGEPRFTRDVDIVLRIDQPDVERLSAAFDPEQFYMPPSETLVEETTRPSGGHFNVIHGRSGLRADVYAHGSDALEAWAFGRRRRIDTGSGRHIWVAPVEYVVLRKLEYYVKSGSDRHLDDVSSILSISGDGVDRAEMERWMTPDVREAWETLAAS